ncbi:MAG: protease modulator HflK [Pseudomonas putida]|jgi:regulator of protease activity HflC (stomatin/prohibitin superfamily)|nr:protease modulator HflK [Pseudomonas putida]
MSFSPGTKDPDFTDTPRFQQSLLHTRHLARLIRVSALVALLLWLGALFIGVFSPLSHWVPLLAINAASLLLLAAAGRSAWTVSAWRVLALGQTPAALALWGKGTTTEADDEPLSAIERGLLRLALAFKGQLQRLGFDALWLAGLALLALLVLAGAWRLDLPAAAPAGEGSWIAVGILALSAFGLVVMERHLNGENPAVWPEAAALGAILRVVIAVQVLSIACLAPADGERLWPVRLAVLLGILPGLLALELMIRAVLSVFTPQRPQQEPPLVARSLVAGSLQWPPRPLAFLRGELHQRFGIDLRQIWAFDFMRRASLPVLALVALVGWLLTGVSEVALDKRGIYERFGNPQAVWQPGLHVGLPWPFGKVLGVDNGQVHELATSGDAALSDPLADAEGPAPTAANRLWDATHVSENAQVIAGASGGPQSFQIVNMDVRFIYRIGLDDAAALAATYHSTDVAVLVRSIANRVLVRDFASRTLDGVLGSERESIGKDIGQAVQADLDRLDSGVEILVTSVEAIHPPAGAANAYHGVQAAQITAQALIARDRGKAAEQSSQARLNATAVTDKASASARETDAKARIAELRFGAERSAWQQAGQAFLLEQYLEHLGKGLGKASSLIIDHRLGAGQAPTLDLRSYSFPLEPTAARSDQERPH